MFKDDLVNRLNVKAERESTPNMYILISWCPPYMVHIKSPKSKVESAPSVHECGSSIYVHVCLMYLQVVIFYQKSLQILNMDVGGYQNKK